MVNFNSIIIYSGLLGFLLLGIFTDKYQYFCGVIVGMIFIYFMLSDESEKEKIKKNLFWK